MKVDGESKVKVLSGMNNEQYGISGGGDWVWKRKVKARVQGQISKFYNVLFWKEIRDEIISECYLQEEVSSMVEEGEEEDEIPFIGLWFEEQVALKSPGKT